MQLVRSYVQKYAATIRKLGFPVPVFVLQFLSPRVDDMLKRLSPASLPVALRCPTLPRPRRVALFRLETVGRGQLVYSFLARALPFRCRGVARRNPRLVVVEIRLPRQAIALLVWYPLATKRRRCRKEGSEGCK